MPPPGSLIKFNSSLFYHYTYRDPSVIFSSRKLARADQLFLVTGDAVDYTSFLSSYTVSFIPVLVGDEPGFVDSSTVELVQEL